MEITVTGSGISFLIGEDGKHLRPLSGKVTELTVSIGVDVWMTITDLTTELPDFDHLMFGWTWFELIDFAPRGQQMLSVLMSGNDRIMGSALDDFLIHGLNAGDDMIFGGDGADVIFAGAGSDSIFGGNDDDTYSLAESFFDGTAYRGAVVNLASGRTIDSWGGRDRLDSIEQVIGSRLSDHINGSGRDETIAGLRGTDTIIGGRGFDVVAYDGDFEFGGVLGVTVDLANRRATDGWGSIDLLQGIEGAIGTERDDVFNGDRGNNLFNGGMRVDRFNGGAGRDTISFERGLKMPSGLDFVRVDLRLASGQVINDGLGNTETVVSIEDLWGGWHPDAFTGNGRANLFFGDGADDTLSGGGGNDTLEGGTGADHLFGRAGADSFLYSARSSSGPPVAPWGDIIYDFRSGTDRLSFVVADFAGMDATVRFRVGTEAGGVGESWFYFDTFALFWGADGIGGAGAVGVAIFAGSFAPSVTLTAADIDLI